jgi:hypothetical protein
MNRNSFQPGNKFGRGRPPGRPNKRKVGALALLHKHEELLMRTLLAKAAHGDLKPLLFLLSRASWQAAARKLKLPPIDTTAGIRKAQAAVVQAVAKGECTDAHGQALGSLLDGSQRLIEKQDIEPRMQELERLLKQRDDKKIVL